MSHINYYNGEIKDALTFMEVAKQKGATKVNIGAHTIQQYGSNTVPCIASCLLPKWQYPIGLTEEGQIAYDNWGSQSGSMDVMADCIQGYWESKVNQSIDWTEVASSHKSTLENGDIQIVLEMN